MKLSIHAVGRMKAGPEAELLARYHDRALKLGATLGISGVQVHEVAESRAGQVTTARLEEAQALMRKLPDDAMLLALDEHGRTMSTMDIKNVIATCRDEARDMAFVIGGADGLDRDLMARARHRIAFGAITLPHQIVRILLAEQIYRAMTIMAGHPYHRA